LSFQLVDDSEEPITDAHPLVVSCFVVGIANRLGLLWHHLIRSSAKGGGKATLKFWASTNCGKANSLRGRR
jgi:hypothetical protein